MSKEIQDYIYGRKDEFLRTLGELIAIPSVMGKAEQDAPFGAEPKRALLKMQEFCEKNGLSVNNYGNAVISADYAPEGNIELGILAHLDVVPVQPSGWNTDPFIMTEKDGILYGRGVIDDKGPAVAALFAVKCVKELGIPLKTGVRLIFGTNEENGSDDLPYYTKVENYPPKVFTPDGSFPVINIEKGMMCSAFSGKYNGESGLISFHGGKINNAVPDRAVCELTGVDIAVLEREISIDKSGAEFSVEEKNGNVTLTCKGKPAHASTPDAGINAVAAMISLINRLSESGAVFLCEKQREIFRGLEKILPFGETDGASCGLKCQDDSGKLTCAFTIFDMERGECSGALNVRFPTCINLAAVEEKETSALKSAGLDFSGYFGDEPHIVDENSEFVRTLLNVYERVEGEKGYCIAIGGGTYVHNIPGGVAFGAERGTTDYHMHGDNEFVTVDELLKDAVLYAEAICEICGQ